MNGEYIKKMDFDEFYELAEPELKAAIKTEGIDLKNGCWIYSDKNWYIKGNR